MGFRFRHSICNEIYKGWDFAAACRHMRSVGYEGIEIAPFTLADDPATIPAAKRRECRDIITAEGLAFVGLHWLMVAPPGLHVTTPDKNLRERSWLHIRNLVDLCADLGPDGVMVFGSPMQRAATRGSTPTEAREAQCDVVTTLAEAAGIVRRIGSPGVRTMFDTHNAVDETEPHASLVERYFELIEHIHVNETDGKHCGAGDYDFAPLLATLKKLNYAGWISLEAFDFSPGAETIARESIHHLQSLIERL